MFDLEVTDKISAKDRPLTGNAVGDVRRWRLGGKTE